jgi:2-phosphosulfolactate phosphatase
MVLMRSLDVHFLPRLVAPDALVGGTAVVIDVLRATTTIVTALAAGAREVLVCGTVAEARRRAAKLPRERRLLGGERGGLVIDGFDLGNSPSEYTPERVRGKSIVFTTTNGTRALLHCRRAKRMLLAGFVNLSAVATMIEKDCQVQIVCAGTRGEIGREDVLLAGALAESWISNSIPVGNSLESWNDQVWLAAEAWRAALDLPIPGRRYPLRKRLRFRNQAERRSDCELLENALKFGQGASDLMALGLHADIAFASQIDQFAIVPVFDAKKCVVRVGS